MKLGEYLKKKKKKNFIQQFVSAGRPQCTLFFVSHATRKRELKWI